MKTETAVELFEAHLIEYGFDLSLHKTEIEKFKQIEKEQKGYSEEEVLELLNNFRVYSYHHGCGSSELLEWFEQFKKK